MTFTVTEGIIDNVLRSVSDGHDPFGIETGLPRAQSGDRAETVIGAALTGLTSAQADAVEAALRKDPLRDPARIDLPTVDLLVARGVDPLAVAWLAWVDDGLSVHDEDLDTVIEFSGEPFGAVTDLSDTAWWHAGCAMAIRGLPDTIVTAARDRMLREVVSHPVLDLHPLVIRDVRLSGSDGYARLLCRREVLLPDTHAQGRPRMMSDKADVHHLVDGHLRLVQA